MVQALNKRGGRRHVSLVSNLGAVVQKHSPYFYGSSVRDSEFCDLALLELLNDSGFNKWVEKSGYFL